MAIAVETCWSLIRDAASGDSGARERFVRLYEPVVHAYLSKRWRNGPAFADVADAAQDVFVALFQPSGALDRLEMDRPEGFRAYLYGVARNIALRYDSKRRPHSPLESDLPMDETGLAEAFDRAWAKSILREAARIQEQSAKTANNERALRRVELLKLRFYDGLPIRDIATQWGVDARTLHHEYAIARDEFRAALLAVVALENPGASAQQVEQCCQDLIALLR